MIPKARVFVCLCGLVVKAVTEIRWNKAEMSSVAGSTVDPV